MRNGKMWQSWERFSAIKALNREIGAFGIQLPGNRPALSVSQNAQKQIVCSISILILPHLSRSRLPLTYSRQHIELHTRPHNVPLIVAPGHVLLAYLAAVVLSIPADT